MSQINNTGSNAANGNTLIVEKQSVQHITNLSPQADDIIQLVFGNQVPFVERVEDNLVFTFDDGSIITLDDFYVVFTSENMPDFLIDGGIVDGESFFAALESPDLMPAAGSAPTPPNNGLNNSNTSDPQLNDPQLKKATQDPNNSDNDPENPIPNNNPNLRTGGDQAVKAMVILLPLPQLLLQLLLLLLLLLL